MTRLSSLAMNFVLIVVIRLKELDGPREISTNTKFTINSTEVNRQEKYLIVSAVYVILLSHIVRFSLVSLLSRY